MEAENNSSSHHENVNGEINHIHASSFNVVENTERGNHVISLSDVSIDLRDRGNNPPNVLTRPASRTFINRSLSGRVPNPNRSEDEDVETEDDNNGERCELEEFTQCSKSHLWKLMMSFYDRKGPESWSQGIVPHFITCNSFIGRSYAKVLQGFIRDCVQGKKANLALDVNEPFYIIELGAGSGKFSYFMLKALEEMKDILDFPFEKIVYVMTDFTENNFNFWRKHSALKKYFENGSLEAGIFDAVNDNKIVLQSGKVLEKGSCVNPICIVANYLFDTLYHDIFQVDGGELKEGLVSTGSKRKEEPDPLEPDIINRLSNLYKYVPISPNYYTDEEGDEIHFARMLQWYKDCYKNNPSGASIIFPIGALRALRRLTAFSNNRALVISGDKGNNNPEQFVGLMDPHIAVHGSFSLMVNYHAVGMWFTSKGGFALHNPQEEASLKVSCFVLNNQDGQDFSADESWLKAPIDSRCSSNTTTRMEDGENIPAMDLPSSTVLLNQKDEERSLAFPYLRHTFYDAINIFGPNDFFVLQKSLKEDCPNPTLKSVVSLLKLGDWDPDVFFKFRDTVLNQISSCGQKLRNDLIRGIPRVWENYYMLDTDKDIAFEIGRFYYGIRDYANALKFYIESTTTVGEHHVTYHNQGLCYYSQGFLDKALENFQKSVQLNAEYEKARNWVDKVTKEINDKSPSKQKLQGISSTSSSTSTLNLMNEDVTSPGSIAASTAETIVLDVIDSLSQTTITQE